MDLTLFIALVALVVSLIALFLVRVIYDDDTNKAEVNVLSHRFNIQSKRMDGLEDSVSALREVTFNLTKPKESSPNLWGYKLDGTPKKKPGRKVQELI